MTASRVAGPVEAVFREEWGRLFDDQAARAYGRIYAATRASTRKPRGARALDLLIAAVALANDLPLFTRNATNFQHLDATGLQVQAI